MRLLDFDRLADDKGITYTRRHLERLSASGDFPKPIKLGGRKIAWLEHEIDAWIERRVALRDHFSGVAS